MRTLIGAALGLLLVAGLGAYAYLEAFVGEGREQRDAVLARLVFDLEPSEVRRLALEAPGERAVVERSQGTDGPAWRLTEPVEAEADGVEVEGVLSSLQLLDAVRRIPAGEAGSAESYGLAKPRLRWELTLADGRRLALRVGKLNPLGQLLYAQVEGADEVLALPGRIESALERTVFDLRRKDLVRFEPDQVERLTLEGGEARLVLARREGRWRLQAPVEDRADERAVGKVLQTLAALRATGFPGANLPDAALGLDRPAAKVRVEGAAPGVRSEVWFGQGSLKSNADRLFARCVDPPGPTIQVGLHVLPVFRRQVMELRDRRLLEFDPAAVSRIRASSEGQIVVLERHARGVDGGWDLVAPVAAPARRLRVQALLGALGELEAEQVLAPGSEGAHGLDAPLRTLALLDAQGGELASLRVGRTEGERVVVKGSARPEPCLVKPGALAALAMEPAALRDDDGGGGGRPGD
ncbi:MAG TPA: DUF4340 domain-containing protein [Myxococcota bacterium]|nr:DUF4340 domain-containing protein [Myxococcota bacterium]HRY93499.1 DUF4340 domain-containing protein [Myxococcota bacterium]HSA20739.1 DUF4340 domain-containing protein [Myxococcota bacterium]